MEIKTACSHQCQNRYATFQTNVDGVPLTIYNITHYHQILTPRRKGENYTFSQIYLNGILHLWSLDRHWRPGEYLTEFGELQALKNQCNYLEECWRLFSLYCQDVTSLLQEEQSVFIHLMSNVWHHTTFQECFEDFIKAFNIFYQTQLSTKNYSSKLEQLEESWKKNHSSVPEVESLLSDSSSSLLPKILSHPSE